MDKVIVSGGRNDDVAKFIESMLNAILSRRHLFEYEKRYASYLYENYTYESVKEFAEICGYQIKPDTLKDY